MAGRLYDPRRWPWLWLGLAAANLAAGVVLALHPDRARDYDTIHRWTRQWLLSGTNLYAAPTSGTDYPPHAIAFLAPIGLLPVHGGAIVWMLINLLLAFAAPLLAAQIGSVTRQPEGESLRSRPREKRKTCSEAGTGPRRELNKAGTLARIAQPDVICLATMYLCWSGSKTLLQFTLPAVVFGLAAMVLAGRRPVLSGLCLGVSLMKPQIGLPFLLWTLFTGRIVTMVAAAVTVGGGVALFCVRASANPVTVLVRYSQILQLYYTGNTPLLGVAQLRPMIRRFVGGSSADTLAAAIALILLGAIVLVGIRSRTDRRRVLYAAPAMAAVWSLLTFYHLTYGFVLLLPAAALLLFDGDDDTAALRNALLWTMQIGLTLDLPGWWRRLAPAGTHAMLDLAIESYYRVVMLVLLAGFCVLALHSTTEPYEAARSRASYE